MTNDELCHYGVLGMKWGVRRANNKNGEKVNKRTSAKIHKAEKKYKKQFNKYKNKAEADAWLKGIDAQDKVFEKYKDAHLLSQLENKNRTKNEEKKYQQVKKEFSKQFHKYYAEMELSDMKKNRNYKKAQRIVEKYSLDKVSDVVEKNQGKYVKNLEKWLNGDYK